MKVQQIRGTTYYYDGEEGSTTSFTPEKNVPYSPENGQTTPLGMIPRRTPNFTSAPPFRGQTSKYSPDDTSRPQFRPTPPPPLSSNFTSSSPYQTASSFFMSEALQSNLLRKAELMAPVTLDITPRFQSELPTKVGPYHSLRNLDHSGNTSSPSLPESQFSEIHTEVFKATNSQKGYVCTLRRVLSPQISSPLDSFQSTIDMWKSIQHPNVVSLKNVILSSDWPSRNGGGKELVLEYSYIARAMTWEQAYMPPYPHPPTTLLREQALWSYICQLVSALKTIHDAGLSLRRGLVPSKILLAPGNRLYINAVGLIDLIFPLPSTQSVEELQQSDIKALSELLMLTACRSTSLEALKQQTHFSPALRQFLAMLASNPPQTVHDLLPYLADRFMNESTQALNTLDTLEDDLMKEVCNGRLFRAVVKMGFINERPEHEFDPAWSEIGDRYVLKLFRDYLFHQCDDKGVPKVDWGHVVNTLNKVDTGSEEKIVLASRDGSNLLVVSFKDIKRLLEESFQELLARSAESYHQ